MGGGGQPPGRTLVLKLPGFFFLLILIFIMHLYQNLGFGDLLQVDKRWTPKQFNSLQSITWRGKRNDVCIAAIKANPAYDGVEQYDYATTPIPFEELTFLGDWLQVLDHLPQPGSTWISNTLRCDLDEFEPYLQGDFWVIQDSTPFNTGQNHRDMQPADWEWTLNYLEKRNQRAIVLNALGGVEPPRHPLIEDLRGRTTVAQSIEILKRATGYLGIDSFLTLLATELFKQPNLWVRCRNPALALEWWQYYPEQPELNFLFENFGEPPIIDWRQTIKDKVMITVRVLQDCLIGLENFERGGLATVDDEIAKKLIAAGHAEKFDLSKIIPELETTDQKLEKLNHATRKPRKKSIDKECEM